jgi:peptidoglycan hydrolase-like protein with peptidoglycan-binding domain
MGFHLSILLLLVAATAFSQTPESDIAADIHDEAVIEVTLYRSVTAEEIRKNPAEFMRQADELVAATQRRVNRHDAKLNAALSAGASSEEVAALRAEFQKRLGTAFDALSRAEVLREIARSAGKGIVSRNRKGVTKFTGTGYFSEVDQRIVAKAFQRRFGRPLPISAQGETALHRSMGFDHSGRLDVALSPDQTEGIWLCSYLRALGIPFFAFRGAVRGAATGAHIHIGPASERIRRASSPGRRLPPS